MQNIGVKLLVVVGLLALCGASIWGKWPPRLGKDLRGGVSMTYAVDMPADEADPQGVLTQTIEVLKDRVNPKGVFDISMEPTGRDRIEVIMPLPNEDVRELQLAFELALEQLVAESEIPDSILDEALRRGDAPATLGGAPTSDRAIRISSLQEAYDGYIAAQEALAALAADAATRGAREFDVAQTKIAYETLYREVLDLSLSESRIRRALKLANDPVAEEGADGEPLRDEKNAVVMGPSQRERELAAIGSEFAHLSALVDEVVVAFDAYELMHTGFDDPEDLKRLLRGAGVLEFHIGVSSNNPGAVDVDDLRTQLAEVGPNNTVSPLANWYPVNNREQWYDSDEELAELEANPIVYFATRLNLVASRYEDQIYLLLYETGQKAMTHDGSSWSLTAAGTSADQLGRPSVVFQLNPPGAQRMGRLTGGNLGEPMAIVLDGEVYSAPVVRGTITSNGQITGNFSQPEIQYLVRVLSAGSLSARLSPEPISMAVLGPTIGADNLSRGMEACLISVIAVAAFMLLYYFFAGFVADLALLANGVIIFGVMMGIDGTFTLPGLAGIVLTIGMAVDANVLIYERIREEIFAGELDLRGCIRQGYGKAMSTILDANITNLIVCFVLFQTATTEVKGFALTLTIGICATLFTALFMTRQIYYLYTDLLKIKKLEMLPTAFPAIHRFLEPNINWLGLRKAFWACSIVAVVAAWSLVTSRGVDLLDTEFRGGISLTMRTQTTGDGDAAERLMLRQIDVETRVRALADNVDSSDETVLAVMREFANASVQTVGSPSVDEDGAVTSSEFQIKVAGPADLDENATITDFVVTAIVDEFGDDLDITKPLGFAGSGASDSAGRVFPIQKPQLSDSIDRIGATQRVPEFIGGVAVLLEGVDPPATIEDVRVRIERMRNQPDFQDYSARKVEVFGLTAAGSGSNMWSDFAVVVLDEHRRYDRVDPTVWYRDVADPEWRLVSTALTQPASLENVSTFSSSVARTLKANATVAIVLSLLGILVYIWVRFGSLRYSIAAIVALVHDVSIALGLLALTTVVAGTVTANALLIEPFRINLGVVAALLTIIGYSLNDTIVILDRIRENRGKLPLASAAVVNRSINQTFSRTLLTSMTTLLAVLIMYVEGGSGIRSFTFCLLVGLFVGTYSSVAIAAPLVFTDKGGGRPASTERSITTKSEEPVAV